MINSTIFNKKFFSEKKFKKFREKINALLFGFYNYLKTDKSKNDLLLLELFNSRNDKNQIYNKLFYLLEIIDYIKKKIKNLEIITDDYSFYETYKSIKLSKINITCLNKKKIHQAYYTILKRHLLFHLKTFIFVFFIKFFKNKKFSSFSNGCISIFPIFFKMNNKNYFFDKNYLNINFQITDETHLNNSLFKNLKSFFEIKKLNNTYLLSHI